MGSFMYELREICSYCCISQHSQKVVPAYKVLHTSLRVRFAYFNVKCCLVAFAVQRSCPQSEKKKHVIHFFLKRGPYIRVCELPFMQLIFITMLHPHQFDLSLKG